LNGGVGSFFWIGGGFDSKLDDQNKSECPDPYPFRLYVFKHLKSFRSI